MTDFLTDWLTLLTNNVFNSLKNYFINYFNHLLHRLIGRCRDDSYFIVIARQQILRINANKFWALMRINSQDSIRSSFVLHHVALSLMVSPISARRVRFERGWVTVTDRWLSRMHGFSGEVPRRGTLTDEWPDDFRKVGMVASTLLSMVTEGWIYYVSGLAIMSVGMMGRRMTGRHRRTETASLL